MNTARHTIISHQRGFTLIELLIAVVIFAIVLAAMNTVFYSALRLRNKTAALIEEKLPQQHAITIMRRDLAGIVAPGGKLGGDLKTQTTAAMDEDTATAFYTSTGTVDDTSPWGEVQKVSYILANSPNQSEGKDLMRAITRNRLPPGDNQAVKLPLMSGVRNLVFLFYSGTDWTDSWDSTTQTNLPKAIKVQIELAPVEAGRPAQAPLEFVVPVLVQARTNQTQQTSGGGE